MIKEYKGRVRTIQYDDNGHPDDCTCMDCKRIGYQQYCADFTHPVPFEVFLDKIKGHEEWWAQIWSKP